ncbi:Imm21 family immunity protein [Actinomadura sp. 6N118]|uniref:Imm21 family immunity protein n=1 Tax=Actinomadura sp. 6N118 TaxID=3375151 RepID=UPI0037AFBC1C
MIWVESAGGPLVVIEESALAGWSGFDGDYERACAVDFVDVIASGDGVKALVVGDEPAGTTYVPELRTFIQWLYAEPDTDVVASVEGAVAAASWKVGPSFDVAGALVLFDSAVPGREVFVEGVERPDLEPRTYDRSENGLRVAIMPGRYQVESADIRPDEETCFRLHRLAPVS